MENSPLIGVLFYALGGLAGASFYLPLNGVKKWAWESFWMIYALAGLIVVPWTLAMLLSPNVFDVLGAAEARTLALCFVFGAMWGIGGLTWGLMIRYLGVGLGLAIGAGICASVGTLMPPVFKGEFMGLLETSSGIATLVGVGIAVFGIAGVGMAGMSKENELSEEQKKQGVVEYNFPLGLTVAIFSGVMSAGMALGIREGDALKALAGQVEPVTPDNWRGLPVLVVVLAGGALINIVWCIGLNLKNRTAGNYADSSMPLVPNYALAALAGFIWYLQFLLLTIGDGYIGPLAFSGWTVLMPSMILFSTVFGIALKEWKGTSGRTRGLLGMGLAFLLASLIVIGYGNFLRETPAPTPATDQQPIPVVAPDTPE